MSLSLSFSGDSIEKKVVPPNDFKNADFPPPPSRKFLKETLPGIPGKVLDWSVLDINKLGTVT